MRIVPTRLVSVKPGDAFNLLLAQIELRQGLPFEVTVQRKPLLSEPPVLVLAFPKR